MHEWWTLTLMFLTSVGWHLLHVICVPELSIGLYEPWKVKKLKTHHYQKVKFINLPCKGKKTNKVFFTKKINSIICILYA